MPNALEMMRSLASNYDGFQYLLLMISYSAGAYFIVRGTYRLGFAHKRAHTHGEPQYGGIYNWMTGSALIALPSIIKIQSASIFSTDSGVRSILDYQSIPANESAALATTLLGLMTFYGWVGIIRGWMIFSDISNQRGDRDHRIKDVVVHLVFGTIAANLLLFSDVVCATLGTTNYLRNLVS